MKTDHSKTNPDLHMLYVKQASSMLKTLNDSVQAIVEHHNLNMIGPAQALRESVMLLIREDKAFFDANEIICSLVKGWEFEVEKEENDPPFVKEARRQYREE